VVKTAGPTSAAGPAYVATVSFVASRAVPFGGFFVALPGGVALARVAQLRGLRHGFGASLATLIETVALMGPARFGVPFTQALSAPVLGRMEGRSAPALLQILACLAIRLLQNGLGALFFIFVIAGGLDAYAGSAENVADLVGLTLGETETLLLTFVGILAWSVFASTVQVTVYRRGLHRWRAAEADTPEEPEDLSSHRGRFDPRAVAVAAVIGFGLLLASTEWALLGAVAAALAVAWALSRPDNSTVTTGLALAAILSLGALSFGLVGGLGIEVALRRALRAALLIAVATWLRAAAGASGLREVGRRTLTHLRALPGVAEAARTLDQIGSEGRLLAAGRSLGARLSGIPRRPAPFLDAVLTWVNREASSFRPARPARLEGLRLGVPDVALVLLIAAPAAAVFL
jgi:hypothetical protein